MAYRILDLDVTQPLSAATLSRREEGIAVLVRRSGRPVAFWMEPVTPGSELTPDDLARRIDERAGQSVLQDRLRDELVQPAKEARLPSLSIAVCTKDRPERLRRCLGALVSVNDPDVGTAERTPEIIVVDNAPSDDRTRRTVKALPGVRYLREPRPGLDFARNRALEAATGDLLAFVDDDVVVDRGWYAGLMEAWTENPDASAFTGLVLPYELRTRAQILFELEGGFRRGFRKIRYDQDLPGNRYYPCGSGIFGAGANMAFRRTSLLEIGGFDEALDTGAPLPGGGDLDIFYRVVRGGHVLVYEPRYLAFHEHRHDIEGLRRQYWSWGLGFMSFVTKSYQADPELRYKLKGVAKWWIVYELMRLRDIMLGRGQLPASMVLKEIQGSVSGLLGGYARSKRRIRKIRRHHG